MPILKYQKEIKGPLKYTFWYYIRIPLEIFFKSNEKLRMILFYRNIALQI